MKEAVREIALFYREKVDRLAQHLYTKGYTYKQLGDILGVTPQAMEIAYPKKKGADHETA